MKICNICKIVFDNGRTYSNHVRWAHKLIKTKCTYCNKEFSCGIEQHEPKCFNNPKNIKYCKQCGKQIIYINSDFCSRSCSAIYSNKNRTYTKIATCSICNTVFNIGKNTLQIDYKCPKCYKKIANKKKPLYNCKCIICNNIFEHRGKIIKTCSKECYRKLLSITSTANANCGGETNYKKYRYNGIYMDSTWELEIAKWLDIKNIEWKRTRKIMFWWTDENSKKRRYYPDFYLPKYNLYIDPKNKYLLEKDQYKLNQVIKEHKINLIYGDIKDIIKILEGAVA